MPRLILLLLKLGPRLGPPRLPKVPRLPSTELFLWLRARNPPEGGHDGCWPMASGGDAGCVTSGGDIGCVQIAVGETAE